MMRSNRRLGRLQNVLPMAPRWPTRWDRRPAISPSRLEQTKLQVLMSAYLPLPRIIFFLLLFFALAFSTVEAQISLKYQKPQQAIVDLMV